MSKFKAGDKVKIIDEENNSHCFAVGSIGTVLCEAGGPNWRLDIQGIHKHHGHVIDQWVNETSLELITSADKVNDLITQGKITITTTPNGNNPFYDDSMNIDKHRGLTLGPDDKWSPDGGLVLPDMQEAESDKPCRLHTWVEVLLLTSTVTECSKCGVLRE